MPAKMPTWKSKCRSWSSKEYLISNWKCLKRQQSTKGNERVRWGYISTCKGIRLTRWSKENHSRIRKRRRSHRWLPRSCRQLWSIGVRLILRRFQRHMMNLIKWQISWKAWGFQKMSSRLLIFWIRMIATIAKRKCSESINSLKIQDHLQVTTPTSAIP